MDKCKYKEKPEVERGVMHHIRYKLKYGDNKFSFSAPKAETRQELGKILAEAAEALQAPEVKDDNLF